MYKLTLTKEDCGAINFSAFRYSWSDLLIELNFDTPGTHELSEAEAHEIVGTIWQDDGAFCPLLAEDSNLASELLRLQDEVV